MQDELARRLTQGPPGEVASLVAALLTAAEESFFYVDLGDGTVTWSRGVEVALGYPPSAVGRGLEEWRERVHPDDRDSAMESFRAALRAGARAWSGPVRLLRGDGTYVGAHVRAMIVRMPGREPGVVGAMTVTGPDDRAELMQVIDDLRRRSSDAQRERDLVARAVSDAVYEWDPESGLAVFGPGWRRLFGHDITTLTSAYEWWIERVHPDDREGVSASLERFLESGDNDSWVAWYRFRCAEGSYVPVRDRAYAVRKSSDGPPHVIGAMTRTDAAEADRPGRFVSERQAEVLDLVRAGHTNKQIAAAMGIGEQAVKGHVSRLFRCFGVASRAALVAAAGDVRIEVSPGPSRAARDGRMRAGDAAGKA